MERYRRVKEWVAKQQGINSAAENAPTVMKGRPTVTPLSTGIYTKLSAYVSNAAHCSVAQRCSSNNRMFVHERSQRVRGCEKTVKMVGPGRCRSIRPCPGRWRSSAALPRVFSRRNRRHRRRSARCAATERSAMNRSNLAQMRHQRRCQCVRAKVCGV